MLRSLIGVVVLVVAAATDTCPGASIDGECWILSEPSQSCADVCGGPTASTPRHRSATQPTAGCLCARERAWPADTSRDGLNTPCGWSRGGPPTGSNFGVGPHAFVPDAYVMARADGTASRGRRTGPSPQASAARVCATRTRPAASAEAVASSAAATATAASAVTCAAAAAARPAAAAATAARCRHRRRATRLGRFHPAHRRRRHHRRLSRRAMASRCWARAGSSASGQSCPVVCGGLVDAPLTVRSLDRGGRGARVAATASRRRAPPPPSTACEARPESAYRTASLPRGRDLGLLPGRGPRRSRPSSAGCACLPRRRPALAPPSPPAWYLTSATRSPAVPVTRRRLLARALPCLCVGWCRREGYYYGYRGWRQQL